MITRNALYSFIENLISQANAGDALYQAQSYRNLRTSIDEAVKVVRIECTTGQFIVGQEPKRSEANVRTTIQCWVIPDVEGEANAMLDVATDDSFEMARKIFDSLASNTNLGAGVCDAYFDEFETGYGNMGTSRRGVTYLDGTVNQSGEAQAG